jgi:hypothetical protein
MPRHTKTGEKLTCRQSNVFTRLRLLAKNNGNTARQSLGKSFCVRLIAAMSPLALRQSNGMVLTNRSIVVVRHITKKMTQFCQVYNLSCPTYFVSI